ncbi:molybdate transport system ATP-binding protein [Oxalobacteraceae bacterium GrIS 2.11]
MSGVNLQLVLANLDVNVVLPGRGITAIIGPSGAGKTTMLRAVAGLEPGARGRVEINDEIWQDDEQKLFLPTHRRALGYVFQEASLFPHLSVQENIEFGRRRIRADDRKIAFDQVVELLGIGALLQRSPLTLSGGERQRVAIARALATSPKLLLMDEPLASLDDLRKAEILPYLDRLHQEFAIPVLYVSHAMDEVAHLADHVVLLEAGKVRAIGSVFEIITRPDLPLAYGDHASALITATVLTHDTHYQLTEAGFSGGTLWLPGTRTTIGTALRLRIQARDVSLSLHRQTGSSILNTVPVSVTAIRADAAGLLMVELDANGTRLLARITSKSAENLGVVTAMSLFAQIKGVAILK